MIRMEMKQSITKNANLGKHQIKLLLFITIFCHLVSNFFFFTPSGKKYPTARENNDVEMINTTS